MKYYMKVSNLLTIFLFLSGNLIIAIPSAQGTHDQVNGCGSDPYAKAVRDEVFANFTEACNNHDRCYGTLGSGKTNCDNRFYNEMIDRCDSTYDDWWEKISRPPCYGSAELYFRAVQAFGESAYSESQGHARQVRDQKSTSSLNFCNRTSNQTVYAAYLSFDAPNGWQSHGWYSVEMGKCRQVSIGRSYNGDIFVYGEVNQGNSTWGRGDTSFCVHRTQAFTVPNSDRSACTANEYKKVSGSKFSIETGINTWNFNP